MGRKADKALKAYEAQRQPERERLRAWQKEQAEASRIGVKRPQPELPKFTYCPSQPKLCEGHEGGPSGLCLACASPNPRGVYGCAKRRLEYQIEEIYQASLRR